jgi:hypothetical protein
MTSELTPNTSALDATVTPPAPPTLSIFDLLETDTSDEENGKWFTDILGDGTNIDLKLRRFQSRHAIKTRETLSKPYLVGHKKKTPLPEQVLEHILNAQIAQSILVDWRGVNSKDGPIPFSAEVALPIVKRLTEFRAKIIELALGRDGYLMSNREEVEKN